MEETITEGEAIEEALHNAAEVLTLTLEGRIEEGLKIPPPSKVKQGHLIAPSTRVQAALLIRFHKDDHTTAELARKLGTSWPAAARLENPKHWPSLKQLERAAHVLNQQVVISMRPFE